MASQTVLAVGEPDFERQRSALRCEQPDAVPALELFHDIEVKEAVLGRPAQTIADDVEFHCAAGYDYYSGSGCLGTLEMLPQPKSLDNTLRAKYTDSSLTG